MERKKGQDREEEGGRRRGREEVKKCKKAGQIKRRERAVQREGKMES